MKAEVEEAVAQEKDAKKPAAPPVELTTEQKVWREVVSWFWVIVAFLLIEGMLVQARVIPSGSMENTVLVGDHLIVSRLGYDAGIPFFRHAVAGDLLFTAAMFASPVLFHAVSGWRHKSGDHTAAA